MLSIVSRSSGPSLEKPSEIARGAAARLSWAWDGLCFAIPLNEASNEGMRDVANNLAPAVVSDASWQRDSRGNAALDWLNTANPTYLQWTDTPRHQAPSTALTVYVRIRNVLATHVDGGLIAKVYSLGSPWTSWSIQGGSVDSNRLYANLTLGTTPTTVGETVAMPTNEFVSAFFRWQTGTAPRFDVLGERGNSLSSLVHGSTLSGSIGYAVGQPLRINAQEASAANVNYDGRYSQVMVWSRRLADTEMTALVSDPFGWYAPRRETIILAGPFPVAAPPATVATLAGTSPYSGASIAPTFGAADLVTGYTVTAGANQSASFTRTVSGSTTTDVVAAGDTQLFPTGASSAADVTYVALDTDDTGV